MSFRISCRSFLSGHLQPVDKETSCICFRTGKFSEPPRLSPASCWAVLKFLIPSTLQIMCKMLRIINIFFQGEVIYEFKSFTRFGALFLFFLSPPPSSVRAVQAGGGGRRICCWPLSQNSSFSLLTHPPCPRGQASSGPLHEQAQARGLSGLGWTRPPPHTGCRGSSVLGVAGWRWGVRGRTHRSSALFT